MILSDTRILEEIKKWSEEFRDVFSNHLNYVSATKEEKKNYKESYILSRRQKLSQQRKENPEFLERVQKVLTWIKDAIEKDEIDGWRELYKNWNGDSDISRDKYNEKQAILGGPYDLRIYLEEWEWSIRQQEQQELIKKLQNLLQTAGINPDDENVQKKVEELRKVIDSAEKNRKTIDLLRRELISIKGDEKVAEIKAFIGKQ